MQYDPWRFVTLKVCDPAAIYIYIDIPSLQQSLWKWKMTTEGLRGCPLQCLLQGGCMKNLARGSQWITGVRVARILFPGIHIGFPKTVPGLQKTAGLPGPERLIF